MKMRKLTRISLILLVGFFAFLVLPVPQVSAAYLYTDIAAYQSKGYPDLSYCIHSSGKLVKVTLSSGLDNLAYVHIISTAGALLGTVTTDVTPNAYYMAKMATVTTLSTTHVLVMVWMFYEDFSAGLAYWRYKIYAYEVNIIAFTSSALYDTGFITTHGDTGGSMAGMLNGTLSKIYLYSSNYYVISLGKIRWYAGGYATNQELALIGYNPSTHALTVYNKTVVDTTSNEALNGNLVTFQDTDIDSTGRYVYGLYAKSIDNTIPVSIKADLDSHLIWALGTGPFSSRYASTRRLEHIGGGLYVDGDDIYVYHTYAYPYISGSYNYFKIIQYRQRFNETTILPTNLQEQNQRILTLTQDLEVTENWIWGYEEEKDSYIYYHEQENVDLGTIELERRISMTDWEDFGSTVWDTVESLGQAAGLFPYKGDTDVIGRDPAAQYSISEDGTNIRVFYALSPISADYDLTLSYAPADVPLLDSASYVFTATGTQNGIGFKHVHKLYVDSMIKATQETSDSGVAKFSCSFNAAIHNITIEMYSTTGTYLYTESWQYAVVEDPTPDEDTFPGMIPDIVQLIAKGLPAMVVIMLPIMGLSRIKDVPPIVSVMSGMTIGVVVATMAGLIPVYLTFTYVLCLAIIMVYMMRK
jgi:hypothetical protein